MKAVVVLGLLLSINIVEGVSLCNTLDNCGSCIGFGEEQCVWCSEANITSQRCQPVNYENTNKLWCKESFIYNPPMLTIFDNISLPLRPRSETEGPVQFTPQILNVKLRPGAKLDFQMSYEPAVDFPLDIYFLLDYSNTMLKHVRELRRQATKVYQELIKFTNNVQFGVGSFVEKPDFPYVNPNIQTAYSFRNHLSLTKDMSVFESEIQEDPKGGNYDDPEGGLDGLMQVMACKKELGWRDEARRIIILCTDATYHSAGDGKMVGAYKPNDMKCHLNKTNYYDYGLIQDYPSVSQLNRMASDGNFKIIFAATANVKIEYEHLSQEIVHSNYAELKENSNIYEIIKDAYLQSIRYVTIKYDWPPNVQLKMSPDCSKEDHCKVGHKEKVVINATLQIDRCSAKDKDPVQTLTVGPATAGLGDKLKIILEIDCRCDCERVEGVPNSPLCSNKGTLQCGICKCNSDRSGNICQCDGGALTSKTDLEKCRHNNQTYYCNGRGRCSCGQCSCNPGYSGNYCEFDDSLCKSLDNKLCAGHGRCRLGKCNCVHDWAGDDCSCSLSTYNCFAPFSKQVCSGNGQCVCGECICTKEGTDTVSLGAFCEEEQCKELEGYAFCNHEHNKTYCDQLKEYNQTLSTGVQLLNKSEINNATWPTAKWCHTVLGNRTLVFIYIYDKSIKKLELIIQNELEDVMKANLWVPVGSAIGLVILIGLITVIVWKIIVDIMDEKEYNKFMQEAKDAGFDVAQNPIYQPAAVNFANPAYNRGRLSTRM